MTRQTQPKQLVQFRVGVVRASEGRTPGGKTFWQLRWTDPLSGLEVKRRVQGDKAQVAEVARHLHAEALQGRGYLPGESRMPTIEAGIRAAVELSAGNAATKADLLVRGLLFVPWLKQRFPAVKVWADLLASHLEAYTRQCEAEGLAHDSIKHRLAAVKMAWRRAHADYPDRVREVPRVLIRKARPMEVDCLDSWELVALLDWLKGHAPDLHAMACLQGLAGLRCWEAAAVRDCDVDWRAGLVRVCETDHHKPKNQTSNRTLPLCQEAFDALKAHRAGLKIVASSGELFLTQRGNPWSKNALCHRWTTVLDRAAKKATEGGTGFPRLNQVTARRLRACFATLADRCGVPMAVLQKYMGHRPASILAAHYRRVDADDLRLIADAMNGWRERAKVEKARKESGLSATGNHASQDFSMVDEG